MTRGFDVFFDLNKRLSKQSWGWWFETPSRPLWRHIDVTTFLPGIYQNPGRARRNNLRFNYVFPGNAPYKHFLMETIGNAFKQHD